MDCRAGRPGSCGCGMSPTAPSPTTAPPSSHWRASEGRGGAGSPGVVWLAVVGHEWLWTARNSLKGLSAAMAWGMGSCWKWREGWDGQQCGWFRSGADRALGCWLLARHAPISPCLTVCPWGPGQTSTPPLFFLSIPWAT